MINSSPIFSSADMDNGRKPGADQKGVAASKMAGVFLKLLVWVLQHTKIVSENIDIDTLDAELFRGMNYQKKLEASWPNTLSENIIPRPT